MSYPFDPPAGDAARPAPVPPLPAVLEAPTSGLLPADPQPTPHAARHSDTGPRSTDPIFIAPTTEQPVDTASHSGQVTHDIHGWSSIADVAEGHHHAGYQAPPAHSDAFGWGGTSVAPPTVDPVTGQLLATGFDPSGAFGPPASAPYPTTAAGTQRPKHRRRWAAIGAGVAAVVAVAGTIVLTQDDHAAAHGTRSSGATHRPVAAAPTSGGVSGTLLLSDSDGYGITDDGAGGCEGASGYSDITEGAQVVVSDGSNSTLGLGTLDAGIWSGSDCSFSFSVSDVPTGRNFYGVTVTHRGTVQFPESQVFAGGLSLTLGS